MQGHGDVRVGISVGIGIWGVGVDDAKKLGYLGTLG